jgi:hypothetical protein
MLPQNLHPLSPTGLAALLLRPTARHALLSTHTEWRGRRHTVIPKNNWVQHRMPFLCRTQSRGNQEGGETWEPNLWFGLHRNLFWKMGWAGHGNVAQRQRSDQTVIHSTETKTGLLSQLMLSAVQ